MYPPQRDVNKNRVLYRNIFVCAECTHFDRLTFFSVKVNIIRNLGKKIEKLSSLCFMHACSHHNHLQCSILSNAHLTPILNTPMKNRN